MTDMESKLVFHSATIDAFGKVSIRWDKQVANRGEVLFSEPHRVSGPTEIIGDLVKESSANLVAMGFPALSEWDSELARQLVSSVATVIERNRPSNAAEQVVDAKK